MRRRCNSRNAERGFTLTEMLIATAVILVGLVAVAQLVPASVMLNSNNRNDATALVLAQRQLEAMREVPMNSTTFTDPLGVLCPLSDDLLPGRSHAATAGRRKPRRSRYQQHAGDRFFRNPREWLQFYLH